ncbi:MAG: sulfotransferase [Flavobacteriia bacterium]|nr:sulfotransferase [Flavobacteriia bacterium]
MDKKYTGGDAKVLLAKILLVVGCQRSGTTLLASMLSRHSEINMLFESVTKDTLRLMGRKYNANKLMAWRQIRIDQRASKFGHLMNRLANFDFGRTHRMHKLRPYPMTQMSLNDYLKYDPKMIVITRKKEDTVNSMLNRTPMTRKQAEKEWELANDLMQYMIQKGAVEVNFDDLVENPEAVMKTLCEYLDLEYEERMMEGPKFNVIYPGSEVLSEKSSASK